MNRLHFNILMTAIVLVYVIGMIQIPLMDIDAAQYASISREMLESKSYLQVFDLGVTLLNLVQRLHYQHNNHRLKSR